LQDHYNAIKIYCENTCMVTVNKLLLYVGYLINPLSATSVYMCMCTYICLYMYTPGHIFHGLPDELPIHVCNGRE